MHCRESTDLYRGALWRTRPYNIRFVYFQLDRTQAINYRYRHEVIKLIPSPLLQFICVPCAKPKNHYCAIVKCCRVV